MRKQTFTMLPIFAGAIVVASCVTPFTLQRHVAEWRFGAEQFTTLTATPAPAVAGGGQVIYTKTFPLPADQNTVFVTLSSTGDTHSGAASWFAALVNGVSCNNGDEGAGFAPPGWVPLQKHPNTGPGGDGGGGLGDLHDNVITYIWCCREGVRPGGPNTVEIKMASSTAGQFVFIERSHFYIDSVEAKLCTEAQPIPGVEAALEAERAKMPEGHRHPG